MYDALPSRDGTYRVLIVGEGPGQAEDSLGRPFVGPSGKFLRLALRHTELEQEGVVLANLVVCRPQDIMGGDNRAPSLGEITACSSRLAELIAIVNPEALVLLGLIPKRQIRVALRKVKWSGAIYPVRHPASVLRLIHGPADLESPASRKFLAELSYVKRRLHAGQTPRS